MKINKARKDKIIKMRKKEKKYHLLQLITKMKATIQETLVLGHNYLLSLINRHKVETNLLKGTKVQIKEGCYLNLNRMIQFYHKLLMLLINKIIILRRTSMLILKII